MRTLGAANLTPTTFCTVYDEAGYQYRLGYQRPVPPPALALVETMGG